MWDRSVRIMDRIEKKSHLDMIILFPLVCIDPSWGGRSEDEAGIAVRVKGTRVLQALPCHARY